jgi:nitric oxide reductase
MVAAKNHPTFVDIKPPNHPTPGVWKRCVHHNDSIPVDVYYRRVVAPFFTREKVDALRHKIQFTVDSVIEEMIKGGCEKPVDLAGKFSAVVPSLVSNYLLNKPTSINLLNYTNALDHV